MIPRRPALARLAWLAWLAWLPCLGPISAAAEPAGARPTSVIVKFRSEGPHALRGCAETLTRRGEPFAPATADGSDSIDALQASLGVRSVRAIFRRPDGSSLAAQRRRLARRFEQVRARRAAGRAAAKELTAAAGLEHVYRVELPAGGDVAEAAARYAADPHVEYAQPNFRVAHDLLDDPFLFSQGSWHQPYADLWGLHRIGAPAAWERTQGEGVVVAVADTGLDYEHPDIAANVWINPGEDLNGNGRVDPEEWNGVDDDGNGFVDDLRGYDFHDSLDANEDGDFLDPEDVGDPDPWDDHGHGTHVSGIVAARGGNGLGIAGVAPRARVMAVRVLGSTGSGETASVWRGVLYAAEMGADVVNGSFSCGVRCPENPLAEQVVRLLIELGSLFVTSAGNRSSDVALFSPEKLRETIAVGNVDPEDALSGTSNFGWLMDVVAPGANILSLRASQAVQPPSAFVGDAYLRLSGTSMSAPHVTGVIALLLADRPGLGYEELRAILRQSAEDLGPPGLDRRTASGLLRPDLALDTVPPDARGAILDPGPGATLDDGARAEALSVRASVAGADLAAHAVELGVGATPDAWSPLPAIGAHGDGETLHRWEIGSAPDGPYVLRLRLDAADGRVLHEFAPLAIDRNSPRLVSTPDAPALNPVVSAARVVWEVPSDVEGALDHDLVAGRIDADEGTVLIDTPEDQTNGAVSGRRVVWQERVVGATTSQIKMCSLRGAGSGCEPIDIAGAPAARGRPSVSGDRIVYRELEQGELRLKLCELARDGRTCVPRRVASQSAAPSLPFIDGRRLLWAARLGGVDRLVTCRLDPRSGACPEIVLGLTGFWIGLAPVGVSGDLVAYQALTVGPAGLGWVLHLCALDPRTGDCPALEIPTGVATGPEQLEAWLSGRRLVWHAATALDRPDVFFCVYDAGRCTVQRITSEMGDQTNPAIDGRDVVWEDDRTGFRRIAALTLPELAPLRDRRVRAGDRVAFDVRALRPEDPLVVVSARTVSGEPVETLGARLEPRGPRRARFLWRPGPEHVGEHVLVMRAERRGGLFDERTLRIEVRERASKHGGRGDRW